MEIDSVLRPVIHPYPQELKKIARKEDLSFMDLSHPEGMAVNDGIDKDCYLGQQVKLIVPKVDNLVSIVKRKGRGCLLFKVDLKRFFKQIPIDPGMHTY